MPKVGTSAKAATRRLLDEDWISEGGAKHEKFAHPGRPGLKITVPRHRTLSPGVSRSIAGAAGWLGGEEN